MLLSLFPGVDLFGRAFEAEGFSVVRGPDVLWGGDVRTFHPDPWFFAGVFGGTPCQDFSSLRRTRAGGYGLEMLGEFRRVVLEAGPEWWLLENVPRVPDLRIDGYNWQRVDVNQGWYSGVSRLRHFQFGSRSGRVLDIPRGGVVRGLEPAALGHDWRGFAEVCRLQGLPVGFDLPALTIAAKIKAVGSGVPIVLGRVVARAVRRAYGLQVLGEDPEYCFDGLAERRCGCGCGRRVEGKAAYAGVACRQRAHRQRQDVKRQVVGV